MFVFYFPGNHELDLSPGERIKYFRKKMKISREDLATKMNLSIHTIAKYEQGQREMDPYTLGKISSAINLNFDILFTPNPFAYLLHETIESFYDGDENHYKNGYFEETLKLSLDELQKIYNNFLDEVNLSSLETIANYYNKNLSQLLIESKIYFLDKEKLQSHYNYALEHEQSTELSPHDIELITKFLEFTSLTGFNKFKELSKPQILEIIKNPNFKEYLELLFMKEKFKDIYDILK
ncbi:MAG: helix-turn-helix domain-containing protein [Clostridium sp.]|uniref:helix-turn-helix domain-containing protein n=1 Tax=Clostridium sp. TaxID=1506 RepID=UPI003EE4DA97